VYGFRSRKARPIQQAHRPINAHSVHVVRARRIISAAGPAVVTPQDSVESGLTNRAE
jgi:hypothetical protein